MAHLFEKNSLSFLLALILLINCNLLDAQILTWKQPILAGYDCYAVDVDSNNYIYSLCETWSHYPGTAFYNTTPVPRTLPEGRNVFITKTDTSNNLLWMKVFETPWCFSNPKMKMSPTQKVLFSGKVYDRIKIDSVDLSFPNHEQPPFIIVQLDSSGHLDWMNLIQNKSYFVYMRDISFDSENNIWLTGNTGSEITFGDLNSSEEFLPSLTLTPTANATTSFIAKYSPDGKFLSANIIPIVNSHGEAVLYIKSMIIDNDDNIYLTGWFDGTIQFGSSMIESSGMEVLILKFNKNMEIVWSKHFGPGSPTMIQQGNSLAFDKSKKNFYVTGNFIGSKDFGNGLVQSNDKNIFLAKYSLDGELKWVKNFGSWSGAASYTEEGQKLYVDDHDFVYLGGIFYSTLQIGDTAIEAYNDPYISNNYSDIFIAKYFANGDFSWVGHAGCKGNDVLGSIVKDKFNHLFVGGSTSQGSHFGEYTIVVPPNDLGLRGFLACFNDKLEINIYETSFGIEERKNVSDNIKIFPNPFIKNLEVEIQNKEHSDISIQLIDINGKTLFSDFEKHGNFIQNYSYQLNNGPSGIYCFKITIGNNVYTYKIVKL